ncbi:uncharacterized LOC100280246 isoform 2 [Zea mays]|uniref:HTH myb-type domain-containing protein n=2 Tax=Zea mays TaxID=4577 RepID=C4J9M4_MAIZE|eukprot:XP_008643519.1 uncharacterized protein LOC100280246 isoform X1 [Zea mays]
MGLDVGEIGMGLDLGLDLRLFAARSAGGMAKGAAPAGIQSCIRSLEVERRKIEVFRRELPLCLRLLADVIDELKEEAAKRGEYDDGAATVDDGDKRKWMSTAQLWVDSDAKSDESDKEQQSEITSPPEPKLLGGGAPTPIRAAVSAVAVPQPLPPPLFRREDSSASSGLSLVSLSPATKAAVPISPPVVAASGTGTASARFCGTTMPPCGSEVNNMHSQAQQQQQASRKARRCWSPELHRRFVAALHELGGPQVATPKQIREVMQVDGLTNDEVKSHLQYRLHNRRSSPGAAAAPVSQSIMLVDGVWAAQEQSSGSQSGSRQGPLQFSRAGMAVGGGDDSSSSDDDEDDDKSEDGYSLKCV